MVRRIVTAVLTRCGFDSVVGTPLASEAAQLVADLRPDVVVLDLVLEFGKELAREAGAHVVIDKVSMANADALEQVILALRPRGSAP